MGKLRCEERELNIDWLHIQTLLISGAAQPTKWLRLRNAVADVLAPACTQFLSEMSPFPVCIYICAPAQAGFHTEGG